MFEIPFNLIFINPIIDNIIFSIILYFFVIKLYQKALKSNEINFIWKFDLKLSIFLIILSYLNYGYTKFYDIHLLVLVPFIYILTESLIIIIFYNKDYKQFLKLQKKESSKKIISKLNKDIEEMNFFKNMLESELHSAELSNDKKAIQKIKKEIQKIEKLLNQFKEEKNKFK